MASTATTFTFPRVPVGVYLGSVFRPDVDYVDGELEERNVGEFDHADIQQAVLVALRAQRARTGVRAMQELRVQVSATRFRVPDVCLLPASLRTPVIREAPLLCVEVLSPRDNIMRMRQRCKDYLDMGVPVVWIFDPERRVAFILTNEGMEEYGVGKLTVPNTSIELDVTEVFATLDDNG